MAPLSDQKLRSLCQSILLRFAVSHQADVYTDIHWDGHHYEGLDLLWDEPNRVLAIAFCCDAARLQRARDDFTLFASTCTFAGVFKKPHLVLFHTPELGGVLLDWPVGISVTPISLSAERRSVIDKMTSLLFVDQAQAAAALADPPDWRRFLTPERVELRVRQLAHEQDLPASLRGEAEEILAIAHDEPAAVRDRLAQYLLNRWRAGV